jgi:hypothetical protein
MRFFVALLVGAAVIAGCGEDDEQAAAPTSTPDSALADLVVEYNADGEGGDDPVPVDVKCASAEDSEVCGRIAEVKPEAFEPTPGDVACTQQYGGPEIVTVTGTFRGEEVNAMFSRQNGCEIARFQDAAPILEAGKP